MILSHKTTYVNGGIHYHLQVSPNYVYALRYNISQLDGIYAIDKDSMIDKTSLYTSTPGYFTNYHVCSDSRIAILYVDSGDRYGRVYSYNGSSFTLLAESPVGYLVTYANSTGIVCNNDYAFFTDEDYIRILKISDSTETFSRILFKNIVALAIRGSYLYALSYTAGGLTNLTLHAYSISGATLTLIDDLVISGTYSGLNFYVDPANNIYVNKTTSTQLISFDGTTLTSVGNFSSDIPGGGISAVGDIFTGEYNTNVKIYRISGTTIIADTNYPVTSGFSPHIALDPDGIRVYASRVSNTYSMSVFNLTKVVDTLSVDITCL